MSRTYKAPRATTNESQPRSEKRGEHGHPTLANERYLAETAVYDEVSRMTQGNHRTVDKIVLYDVGGASGGIHRGSKRLMESSNTDKYANVHVHVSAPVTCNQDHIRRMGIPHFLPWNDEADGFYSLEGRVLDDLSTKLTSAERKPSPWPSITRGHVWLLPKTNMTMCNHTLGKCDCDFLNKKVFMMNHSAYYMTREDWAKIGKDEVVYIIAHAFEGQSGTLGEEFRWFKQGDTVTMAPIGPCGTTYHHKDITELLNNGVLDAWQDGWDNWGLVGCEWRRFGNTRVYKFVMTNEYLPETKANVTFIEGSLFESWTDTSRDVSVGTGEYEGEYPELTPSEREQVEPVIQPRPVEKVVTKRLAKIRSELRNKLARVNWRSTTADMTNQMSLSVLAVVKSLTHEYPDITATEVADEYEGIADDHINAVQKLVRTAIDKLPEREALQSAIKITSMNVISRLRVGILVAFFAMVLYLSITVPEPSRAAPVWKLVPSKPQCFRRIRGQRRYLTERQKSGLDEVEWLSTNITDEFGEDRDCGVVNPTDASVDSERYLTDESYRAGIESRWEAMQRKYLRGNGLRRQRSSSDEYVPQGPYTFAVTGGWNGDIQENIRLTNSFPLDTRDGVCLFETDNECTPRATGMAATWRFVLEEKPAVPNYRGLLRILLAVLALVIFWCQWSNISVVVALSRKARAYVTMVPGWARPLWWWRPTAYSQ
jgi:hypothetical protein